MVASIPDAEGIVAQHNGVAVYRNFGASRVLVTLCGYTSGRATPQKKYDPDLGNGAR